MAEPNQKVCDSIPFHQHVKVSLGWILNPKLLLLAVPLVCGCVYECCYWSWWAGGALHGSLCHQCVKWWMHCFSLCVKACTANIGLQFTAALKSLVWLLYRVTHEDWIGVTRRICLPDHNLSSVKTKHVCVLDCHCLQNTLDQRPIFDFVWSANVYLRWPDEKRRCWIGNIWLTFHKVWLEKCFPASRGWLEAMSKASIAETASFRITARMLLEPVAEPATEHQWLKRLFRPPLAQWNSELTDKHRKARRTVASMIAGPKTWMWREFE